MRIHVFCPQLKAKFPAISVYTEIYQLTGPVERICRQIASMGYLVACPESYHDFLELGTVIPYDSTGTDLGNRLKVEKELGSYDEDAKCVLDFLEGHPQCIGRFGAVGMCLGGMQCERVTLCRSSSFQGSRAAVCYFATDIHSETLGKSLKSDSLARSKEIQGELLMIFGKQGMCQ